MTSTLLIVDDSPIVRDPLTRLLESSGYRVLCAANGSEALAMLRAFANVDLVLLDVMMPRMHGVAFAEALRADARFATLPIIGLTGVIDSSMLIRLRELGVSMILEKARFTFTCLLAAIRDALPPRPAADAI